MTLVSVFRFLNMNDKARATASCFEWWSVIKRVSPNGMGLGGVGSIGNRKAVLFHPTKGILIPHKPKYSFNRVDKSPFLTTDAICDKLTTTGYF